MVLLASRPPCPGRQSRPHGRPRTVAWSDVGRLLGLRVLPAMVFGIPGLVLADSIRVATVEALRTGRLLSDLPALLGSLAYATFVLLATVLVLARPPARARDARAVAWALAMAGTFGMILGPGLPEGPELFHLGQAGQVVRLGAVVVALVLATVTLSVLGRSFSLTPEARSVVAHGPYRLVRHPLYLCESVTIVAATLAIGRLTIALVAAGVLVVQVVRARLEEAILSATFPEYQERFAGVPHFLPGIY